MQMAAPASVSTAYSEVDMKLSLAAESNSVSPCVGAECELDRAFDQKVLRLGTYLAQSAFEAYPDLANHLDKFEFVIAEKANPGSISSAAGTVIIFRGVQKLHLGDETLAFLIAREMGHVISRHHEENSATRIWFSVMAAMFIPVSSIASGSASAASYIGSKLTIDNNKLDQLHEADAIALNLLGRLGWKGNKFADDLIASTRLLGDDRWSKGLRTSAENAVRLAEIQNSVIGLNVDSNSNENTVIKSGMLQPPASLPTGFTTNGSPGSVLDYLNTPKGSVNSNQNSHERGLHSINIAQVTGRTRLVVNSNGCFFVTSGSTVRAC
jgi:hypothetical protein